jgi:hypothetical protein
VSAKKSPCGLTLPELNQLDSYIAMCMADDWHYGNREQFEARAQRLTYWIFAQKQKLESR